MKTALLYEQHGLKTLALVFESGDEVIAGLTAFAQEHQVRASHFTAIGAFSDATVAYFDWQTKQYRDIVIPEQVEVLSLIGDITYEGPRARVHAHVVVGKRDATAHGGHLRRAHVRPTLEVVLTETPHYLRRRFDPASGLALIDPSASGERDGGTGRS